ncbi:hypothetical protein [Labrys neptuniae]
MVYAASGGVSDTTDRRGTWVVLPNSAVWVPAHVGMRLSREFRVVEISPFVRESILRLDGDRACSC